MVGGTWIYFKITAKTVLFYYSVYLRPSCFSFSTKYKAKLAGGTWTYIANINTNSPFTTLILFTYATPAFVLFFQNI
jgi:hypothetical protein